MKENNDQSRIQKNNMETSPLNSNNCTTINTVQQQNKTKQNPEEVSKHIR